MRIVALYDIHANLPALEAVLPEVMQERPDLIVIGGDVIPGPMPAATLDLLLGMDTAVRFIHGNGEIDVLTCLAGREPIRVPEQHREVVRWTAGQLSEAHAREIQGWPLVHRISTGQAGDVLFCHATPESDNEIITRNTPAPVLAALCEPTGASIVVCGHTHMQFEVQAGSVRLVNAGSVGMPFGGTDACWLVIDEGIRLRQTAYNRDAAASRIRSTDYPAAAAFAEQNVLSSPAEADVLAMFDRVARRES